MRSLGGTHLLVLAVLVLLLFDSRRLHALVGWTVGGRRDPVRGQGLPAGVNGDQVGLPLRRIQMRNHVDWQDGGIGWEGPEILPVDDCSDTPVGGSDDCLGEECVGPDPGDAPADSDDASAADCRRLPVLWKPFPAFLAVPEVWRPTLSHPRSWSAAVLEGVPHSFGTDEDPPPEDPAECPAVAGFESAAFSTP